MTADALLVIAATFLAAGFVKGVAGVGLPTVAVALLSLTLDQKQAMALLLLPSFVTNVWQAVAGPAFAPMLRRIWPLLAMIALGTWAGVRLLSGANAATASYVLGAVLVGYGLLGLFKVRVPPPGRNETAISVPLGLLHGVLAGLTGSFIPAVPFLQSLRLPKNETVQALGIMLTTSSLALAAAMGNARLLTGDLMTSSALAILPALAGMGLGQIIRHRLSEEAFRNVLFGALMLLGFYIAWRAMG